MRKRYSGRPGDIGSRRLCGLSAGPRGEQTDAGVQISLVVPIGKAQQELRASSIDPKRPGNSRRYLRAFNCPFREGVVIGDVWPAMSLGKAEVGDQTGHGL